jgi:membrane protein YqaA with SNARE-associated domain
MWWAYLLVFLGTMIVDLTPLPLPPAFTLMILLQSVFHLDIWPVIALGVIGSAVGRYLFSLYIGRLSDRVLMPEKVKDIQYLGGKLGGSALRSQGFTLFYTLLPVSSTPLFVTAGIARLRPLHIIPAFMVGKFVSDALAVHMGHFVITNSRNLATWNLSPETLFGLVAYALLLMALLFIDWRTLLMHKKLRLKFQVWAARKMKGQK